MLRVHAGDPNNMKDLIKFCKEEWLKLPASVCKKLVSSIAKHLEAVKWNKEYATKY